MVASGKFIGIGLESGVVKTLHEKELENRVMLGARCWGHSFREGSSLKLWSCYCIQCEEWSIEAKKMLMNELGSADIGNF